MAKWIDGKTVILTGASSGIGKMLAERLMKEHGCKVIGVARSEAKMIKFNEELGEYFKLFRCIPLVLCNGEHSSPLRYFNEFS